MTIAVEQEVAIMSVFDLEEVRYDRIASQGYRKVLLCACEFSGRGVSVGLLIALAK